MSCGTEITAKTAGVGINYGFWLIESIAEESSKPGQNFGVVGVAVFLLRQPPSTLVSMLSFRGPHEWIGVIGFQGQETVHEVLGVFDVTRKRSLIELVLKPVYWPVQVDVVFGLSENSGDLATAVKHGVLDFASKHSDVFGDIELHVIEVKLVAVRVRVVQGVDKISKAGG